MLSPHRPLRRGFSFMDFRICAKSSAELLQIFRQQCSVYSNAPPRPGRLQHEGSGIDREGGHEGLECSLETKSMSIGM